MSLVFKIEQRRLKFLKEAFEAAETYWMDLQDQAVDVRIAEEFHVLRAAINSAEDAMRKARRAFIQANNRFYKMYPDAE